MKCMVIDGNSIINRAYYGIRPLTNREGLYTHAIFGFLTTLLRLKEEEQPDALCVTFDVHAPTFRHKADEAYKATRKPMPEELRMQVPVLKEVLDALNIPRYELEGWEADDLIGTISRKCEAAGWDCVVVTGDKDSLQLITDHTKVKLVSTRMGQTTTKDMTPETFREQYGFAPIHMIDLKALMGDASDNIPGVPGIGEKTAMDLIQKYGSIDAIYEKLPDIDAKPAARQKADGRGGERPGTLTGWPPLSPMRRWPSDPADEPGAGAGAGGLSACFCGWNFPSSLKNMDLTAGGSGPGGESAGRDCDGGVRHARKVRRRSCWSSSGKGGPCDGAGPAGSLRCHRGLRAPGTDTAVSAELFFERYAGDWNALLNGPVCRRHQKGEPQRQGPDAHAAGKRPERGGLRVRHGAGGLSGWTPPAGKL